MFNYVINNALYSDICSYILITIHDVTSCMYCGIHVGAPGLLLKPSVTILRLLVVIRTINLYVDVMSLKLLDLINQVYSDERNSHLLLSF
jgi:hypothetical protein